MHWYTWRWTRNGLIRGDVVLCAYTSIFAVDACGSTSFRSLSSIYSLECLGACTALDGRNMDGLGHSACMRVLFSPAIDCVSCMMSNMYCSCNIPFCLPPPEERPVWGCKTSVRMNMTRNSRATLSSWESYTLGIAPAYVATSGAYFMQSETGHHALYDNFFRDFYGAGL